MFNVKSGIKVPNNKVADFANTVKLDEALHLDLAGPRSTVGRAPDSLVRGPGFDTRSGHLLPLIQERQLSVTGKSMCMKYWLTA